ncbi:MAG: GIY-YIG nuclease family protein [Nitrospira sp.]|nr:GIY-YIG nuclease family protein [Nitrospira sp.]
MARSRQLARQTGGSAIPDTAHDMYHVYILLNEARTKTYTGVSDDIVNRLREHNEGHVKSSRPYRPYRLIHTEAFSTLSDARKKERFYKSTTGRRRLKDIISSKQ